MNTRLVELLRDAGAISPVAAQATVQFMGTSGTSAPQALVVHGGMNEGQVAAWTAHALQLQQVDLEQVQPSAEVLARIPHVLRAQLQVWPVALQGTSLYVACADPTQPHVVRGVQEVAGVAVVWLVAPASRIAACIAANAPAIPVVTGAIVEELAAQTLAQQKAPALSPSGVGTDLSLLMQGAPPAVAPPAQPMPAAVASAAPTLSNPATLARGGPSLQATPGTPMSPPLASAMPVAPAAPAVRSPDLSAPRPQPAVAPALRSAPARAPASPAPVPHTPAASPRTDAVTQHAAATASLGRFDVLDAHLDAAPVDLAGQNAPAGVAAPDPTAFAGDVSMPPVADAAAWVASAPAVLEAPPHDAPVGAAGLPAVNQAAIAEPVLHAQPAEPAQPAPPSKVSAPDAAASPDVAPVETGHALPEASPPAPRLTTSTIEALERQRPVGEPGEDIAGPTWPATFGRGLTEGLDGGQGASDPDSPERWGQAPVASAAAADPAAATPGPAVSLEPSAAAAVEPIQAEQPSPGAATGLAPLGLAQEEPIAVEPVPAPVAPAAPVVAPVDPVPVPVVAPADPVPAPKVASVEPVPAPVVESVEPSPASAPVATTIEPAVVEPAPAAEPDAAPAPVATPVEPPAPVSHELSPERPKDSNAWTDAAEMPLAMPSEKSPARAEEARSRRELFSRGLNEYELSHTLPTLRTGPVSYAATPGDDARAPWDFHAG